MNAHLSQDYTHRIRYILMSKYGECLDCGYPLSPVWFEAKERNRDGNLTGRVKTACSYLLCENCGHTVIVDGTFDLSLEYK